jgi:hypothetical protein
VSRSVSRPASRPVSRKARVCSRIPGEPIKNGNGATRRHPGRVTAGPDFPSRWRFSRAGNCWGACVRRLFARSIGRLEGRRRDGPSALWKSRQGGRLPGVHHFLPSSSTPFLFLTAAACTHTLDKGGRLQVSCFFVAIDYSWLRGFAA